VQRASTIWELMATRPEFCIAPKVNGRSPALSSGSAPLKK
jgi:hypothetical protein